MYPGFTVRGTARLSSKVVVPFHIPRWFSLVMIFFLFCLLVSYKLLAVLICLLQVFCFFLKITLPNNRRWHGRRVISGHTVRDALGLQQWPHTLRRSGHLTGAGGYCKGHRFYGETGGFLKGSQVFVWITRPQLQQRFYIPAGITAVEVSCPQLKSEKGLLSPFPFYTWSPTS